MLRVLFSMYHILIVYINNILFIQLIMTIKEDILDYKKNGWKPLPKKYFNLNQELLINFLCAAQLIKADLFGLSLRQDL